jgi:hypothetical protein
MPTYRVCFLKRVVDGSGREQRICQRIVVVEADGSKAALVRAKALFCTLEAVAHWSFRSDGHDLELVEREAGTRKASLPATASGLRPSQASRQRPLAEIDA